MLTCGCVHLSLCRSSVSCLPGALAPQTQKAHNLVRFHAFSLLFCLWIHFHLKYQTLFIFCFHDIIILTTIHQKQQHNVTLWLRDISESQFPNVFAVFKGAKTGTWPHVRRHKTCICETSEKEKKAQLLSFYLQR